MKAINANNTVINAYLQLLKYLSPSAKHTLILKLSKSAKADIADNRKRFKSSFGAFISDKSADEIIREIRDSRIFTRNRTGF